MNPQLESKILTQVKSQIGKNQKEYFLSEQLKIIEKELGTHYRQDAIIIAHDRYVLRRRALRDLSFKGANRYAGSPDKDRD